MLKNKIVVNYRRATERYRRCKYCASKKWTAIYAAQTGEPKLLRHEWRCVHLGPEISRRYGLRDDHVCDRYVPNGEKPNV